MIKKATAGLLVLLAATVGVQAGLVGTVDYSDSFTLTEYGGAAERIVNVYPVSDTARNVENSHGNTPVQWTAAAWSISDDARLAYLPKWGGGNGRGSATGMTQTGGDAGRWGLSYTKPDGTTPLRDTFVVQLDATLTADWVSVTSKAQSDYSEFDSGSLTVFFRQSGSSYGIGLFSPNPTLGETKLVDVPASGWTEGSWHNLAVEFAPTTLKVYGDEILLASVDLTNVSESGKDYTGYSHTAVGTGFANAAVGTVHWTDNFVVGAVPEPTTMGLLALGGGLSLLRRKRG